MFNGTNYSLADISAATRGNDDGFGSGNGFLWLILILFLANGRGFGYGYGGGYGGGEGVATNYVLSSDFATIQRQLSDGFGATESKLDSINNGICSLGYDQLGQMNGINTNILTAANGIQRDITDLSFATQNCCCQTKQAINDAASAIIANDNANYRSLHDEIVANRIEDKNAQIQQLQTQLNLANLAASQCSQTAEIIGQLQPKVPQAAYVVPNPFCNCNCGCGNY